MESPCRVSVGWPRHRWLPSDFQVETLGEVTAPPWLSDWEVFPGPLSSHHLRCLVGAGQRRDEGGGSSEIHLSHDGSYRHFLSPRSCKEQRKTHSCLREFQSLVTKDTNQTEIRGKASSERRWSFWVDMWLDGRRGGYNHWLKP